MTNVRFTVKAGNDIASLFKAEERQDGLALYLQSARNYLEVPQGMQQDTAEPPDHWPASQQRYSIHYTPNNSSENSIKHTLRLEDGRRFSHVQTTRAIKNNGTFAPLFIRRCTDLRNPRYRPNSETNSITNIGQYNPSKSMLFYMVLVSNENILFPSTQNPTIGLHAKQIAGFNLTVLSSLWRLPSSETGELTHIASTPIQLTEAGENPIRSNVHIVNDGITADQATAYYRHMRKRLCDRFIIQHELEEVVPTVFRNSFRSP